MSDALTSLECASLYNEDHRTSLGKTKPMDPATYLRLAWSDYLSVALVALLTDSIYLIPMHPYDYHGVRILLHGLSGNLTEPLHRLGAPAGLDYPYEEVPLSSFQCGLVVIFVPLGVIGIFQLRIRSLWDFHSGVIGLVKALVTTTFVCVVLKHFVGGFRPYYLDVCKPDMRFLNEDPEFAKYWFNTTACTGNKHEVVKALQTFPSGHTANSFAAATFLTLYLNAKLKVFADYAAEFWAVVLVLAPLIGASLISGSMYISHQHHGYDVVWGMIIGTALGILSYRSGYAAVFDFRYNHIPLLPFSAHVQFNCTSDGSSSAVGQLLEDVTSEEDRLVAWNWWRQPPPKKNPRITEITKLCNHKNLSADSQEMGSVLKERKDNRTLGAPGRHHSDYLIGNEPSFCDN